MLADSTTSANLAAALDYCARGWAVLPLTPGEKTPHFAALEAVHGSPEWGGLAKRSASAPEIRAWFEVDPAAGVGILTGTPSNGLVVADVDDPGRFGGPFPMTPTVRTGRGLHLYLQADRASVRNGRTSWGDLKAGGGYVAAPPSIHPSGSAYEWTIGPENVDLAGLSELGLGEQETGASSLGRDLGIPTLGGAHTSLGTLGASGADRTSGTGDRLAAVESAVAAALPVLRIAAPLEQKFHCVIPGHDEQGPSASVYQGNCGVWQYRDWHAREGREWWSLAEVHRGQVAGRLDRLKPTLRARWYRRLFTEAGVIEPAPVALAPLPPGAAEHVERVRRGFQLLAQVRDGQDPDEPMPYTRRFAAEWCGLTEWQAREGIDELRRLRVIAAVDEYTAGARSMNLYRPGPGPTTLQRAERAAERLPKGRP